MSLFSFFCKIGEQKGGTGPTLGVLVAVGEGGDKERVCEDEYSTMYKNCVCMHVNEKMILFESIPGMGKMRGKEK
jgi:hypothetical protein